MYKKTAVIMVLLMAAVMMCSCGQQASTPSVSYEVINEDWYGYDVKKGEGAIICDYVPDAATAQAIGDAVIKGITGEEAFKELNTVFIEYDEGRNVWLVSRYTHGVVGGGYTCAIRKSSGEILTVVAGE